MSAFKVFRVSSGFVALTCLFLFASAGTGLAQLESQELKCSKALAKSTAKLYSTILKNTTKCRDADISGKQDDPGLCSPLTGKAADKVAKAEEKLASKVAKACTSVCGLSNDIACSRDLECPPNGSNRETCVGVGGTNPFNSDDLGFPGPYCEAILGHTLSGAGDIAACVSAIAARVADDVVTNLYADIDESAALSKEAAGCLSKLGKAASKGPAKIATAIGKCRDEQNDLDGRLILADACATSDAGAIKAITKNIDKADKTIDKSCSTAALSELNLCGAGVGGITDAAGAKACVGALLLEAADSQQPPVERSYVTINLVDGTHPDAGVATCGDGLINEGRTSFNGVGEECEVGDDSACGGGNCFPPGDAWECTCDTTARLRFSVDGPATDSDAGWTGGSHDAVHVTGQGFTAEVTNCDCDDLDDATCVGSTSDSVCDTFVDAAPTCSGPDTGMNCDAQGDNDDVYERGDCFVCDENSINAGDYCGDGNDGTVESACQSQCFNNTTNTPTGPCDRQTDCAAGETCKGRCDSTQVCDILSEGAPLPLIAATTPVCVNLALFSDIVGTRDIVTAEEELFYQARSFTHFGISTDSPCPECAGTCSDSGEPCLGRCDVSDANCIVDSDCTGLGDTTCLSATPECPGAGAVCNLVPVCTDGPNAARSCRPGAETPFGVVSADCPPFPSANITGSGVKMNHDPMTSGSDVLTGDLPCSALGFHNFSCPCPDDGGAPTKPNNCNAACNAGANLGLACPDFTRCVGGTDAGSACDEDADCEGGTCTGTANKCTAGGPVSLGASCSVNADCDSGGGGGDGVCEPACPGGLCTPLCVAQGICDGASAFPGTTCTLDEDCDGGTCLADDPFDGNCAAGPTNYRCDGEGFTGNPCVAGNVGTETGCEFGPDGSPDTADDLPGAGICRPVKQECFLDNGYAEGGTTLNGLGDPSNVSWVSVVCTPRGVSAINPVSGFGGPQRLRRKGTVTMNVETLP